MITKVLEEIKEEARNSKIMIKEDGYRLPIFMGFNIVDNTFRIL